MRSRTRSTRGVSNAAPTIKVTSTAGHEDKTQVAISHDLDQQACRAIMEDAEFASAAPVAPKVPQAFQMRLA